MNNRLVQVADFSNEVEANYVRSVLSEHGIVSFVDGGNTNTMLSHLRTALGGVRLLTSSTDAESAREIIESIQDQNLLAGPWYCGVCQHEVDAGFDICWQCGGARSEVASTTPPLDAETVPPEILPRASSDDDTRTRSQNPYLPPSHELVAPDNEWERAASFIDVEALVKQTHLAAWIGVFMLPMFALPLAFYLLLKSARYSAEFTANDRARWNRAFALSMVGAGLWTFGYYMWYFELNQ
ncbi:MAG: DUF2007 domain-containing protein [Planctomycetales bacterium]|nr:DUF2007 domain-containing protein [Planctomycetales bacterium]